jgi:hypothetical protein
MTACGVGTVIHPPTLLRSTRRHRHVTKGDAMVDLDRTVWTAPVRNLVWVAAQFGHR